MSAIVVIIIVLGDRGDHRLDGDEFLQRVREIAEHDPGVLAADRRRTQTGATNCCPTWSKPSGATPHTNATRWKTSPGSGARPSRSPPADGALPSQARSDVEQALSGAVRNLIVSVEAYPDLKSNQNFLELQRQLTETEDRIAAGRRFYNANVRVYNTRIESVPSNVVANAFKFAKATYFERERPQRPADAGRQLRRDRLPW